VRGDDAEQAAGIGDHARSPGDGAGPGEGFGCLGRAGLIAGYYGRTAQRQRPGPQRGHVPVRQGQ